jgi:hypothetical protein
MKRMKPEPTEYAPSEGRYVALVPEKDILAALGEQLQDTLALLHGVTEDQANTRHAPYTWSVKEVIGHMTDTERIYGYRALRFARKDSTPLPGFEENDYVRNATFDAYPLSELVAEFELVRRSHLCLFRHLPGEAWLRSGSANGNLVTVRALAYIMAGHARHHVAILRKRLSGEATSKQ